MRISKSANQQRPMARPMRGARPDLSDGLVVGGLLLLGFGLGMVSVELALCVVGGLLMALGLVGAVRKGAA